MKALLLAALLTVPTSAATITSIDGPATAYKPAVRTFQTLPPLSTGTITDTTDGALEALRELFTTAELDVAGQTTITYHDIYPVSGEVPFRPQDYTECLGAPMCVLIDGGNWSRRTHEEHLQLVAHEWGHVISSRFRDHMYNFEFLIWEPKYNQVGEECLADAVSALVLARSGHAPRGLYVCSDATKAKAAELAQQMLSWAEEIS